MDLGKFTDEFLCLVCVFSRGGFEQNVENGFSQQPDTCHGEPETFD